MAFDAPIERAQRWDIYIQQGSTFERSMEFVGADISLFSFRGDVRASHASPDVLASFDFVVEVPNKLHVKLDAAVTAGLPAGAKPLVYDIEAYLPDDAYVARVLEGRVRVSPEATR